MKTWDDWKSLHQPYELNYHLNDGIKWCADEDQFQRFWSQIFEFAKPEGKSLLDIGCGPRPPLMRYAVDHEVHVLDPLLAEYQKATPPEWWEGLTVYSQPGEEPIPRQFDFVMSWNCLDHTPGWEQVIDNVASYLKKGGIFVCATDFRPACIGHPGFEQEAFEKKLTEKFTILDTRLNFAERHKAFRVKRK